MKSIFAAILLVCAQLSAVDALASFLPAGFNAWWWQSLLSLEDRLYIEGGEIYSLSQGGFYGETIIIDLTKNWTTSDVRGTSFRRNVDFAASKNPQIFYDPIHDIVYNKGGQLYGSLYNPVRIYSYAAPQVWGFSVSANKDGAIDWSERYTSSDLKTFNYTSNIENGLWTSTDKKHYSLGGSIGFLRNSSDFNSRGELAIGQFVIYDYETETFENRTHPSHYLMGEAQYVPIFGEEGVLIFFAGKTPVSRNVADDNIADTGILLVYDIHNDKFYNQTVSNAPAGRYDSCSVGASNAQNNSYEIFMYGGTTNKNTANNALEMSKVMILSLPSFTWIEAPERADTWRTAHDCESIGPSSIKKYNQRQMISVGGTMVPNPDGISLSKAVDSWTSGMKILDLTELTWGDKYDATAKPYERPQVVNDHYENNSGYPETWDDPDLEKIFVTSRSLKVKKPTTTTTTGSTPSPTDPTSPNSPSSTSEEPDASDGGGSINVGAIAGGVVGGVVGLALIALGVFFWRRRPANDEGLDYVTGGLTNGVYGPSEMPVGYKDEPKVEMPLNEHRTELP